MNINNKKSGKLVNKIKNLVDYDDDQQQQQHDFLMDR